MESNTEITNNWKEAVETFDELDLKPDLLRGIYDYGLKKPSPIQSKGILAVLKGKDTIGQAPSGTGKTATFAISALQLIDAKSPRCQALIVVPSRELAHQTQTVITCLGQFLNISVHVCVGGTSVTTERKRLQEEVHVVVGTPGRVHDLIKRGFLSTKHLKLFVLDEADALLGELFKDYLQDIIRFVPANIQIALFSTTMPPEFLAKTKDFMRDPATILLRNEELGLDDVREFFFQSHNEENKFEDLVELFNTIETQQCIIYCNSMKEAIKLTQKLEELNFTVVCPHCGMELDQRNRIMRDFRNGTSKVLITTNMLARGIDIEQVSLVINYELPREIENYIHRVGRTGRFGTKGIAINFFTPDEEMLVQKIEKFYKTKFVELPIDLATILEDLAW